jgi:hypothetical protein
MAAQNEPTTTPSTPVTGNDLIALGKAIAAGINEAQPKRRMSYAEYNKREAMRNPVPKLKWDMAIQNGIDMQFIGPTAAKEIALMNRITHSGRYFDRKLEVIVRDEGAKSVELRYPWRSIDQRLDMRNYWRNLTDMLEQIVTQQELEDLEQATAPKRRQ